MLKATLLGTMLIAGSLFGTLERAWAVSPQTAAQEAARPPETDLIDYTFVFTQQNEAAAALAAEIAAWLSANFDLPAVDQLPRIAFASPTQINALRYRGMIRGQSSEDLASLNSSRQTVAIYLDEMRTIYLPEGWSGKSPAETSVLVHEMVHHIQNLAQIKHECPQARERLAYVAQERWLRRFDLSLETEFEVDPFTILVRTRCVY